MTRRAPRRCWLPILALLGSTAASQPSQARADAGPGEDAVELVVLVGESTPSAEAWLQRLQERAPQGAEDATRLLTPAQLAEHLALTRDTIERVDVQALADVQAMLAEGRALASQLNERAAYQRLMDAERRLLEVLHIPGAAWLLAETYTAQGLVAGQAGWRNLAQACLRRAAVIDPARGVRAAETTPQWVAMADGLARQVAVAPQGELPIHTEPSGARVYLDDQLQGTTPLLLRAKRGVHVLRVEAPGHRALGLLLPVEAGTRPEVALRLAQDPLAVALRRLSDGARTADTAAVLSALGELQRRDVPVQGVWFVRTAESRDDRALLTRCDVSQCTSPARLLLLDPVEGYGVAPDPTGPTRDPVARQIAWLAADPASASDPQVDSGGSVWAKWVVWTGALVLAGTVTALAIAASGSAPEERLRVTVAP